MDILTIILEVIIFLHLINLFGMSILVPSLKLSYPFEYAKLICFKNFEEFSFNITLIPMLFFIAQIILLKSNALIFNVVLLFLFYSSIFLLKIYYEEEYELLAYTIFKGFKK